MGKRWRRLSKEDAVRCKPTGIFAPVHGQGSLIARQAVSDLAKGVINETFVC